MAKIKILLEKGETKEDIQDALEKALSIHKTGILHDKAKFEDEAMNNLASIVELKHEKMIKATIIQIINLIKSEYSK
jgi:acid stress-induced BolA-like protein IbaG/YrbA